MMTDTAIANKVRIVLSRSESPDLSTLSLHDDGEVIEVRRRRGHETGRSRILTLEPAIVARITEQIDHQILQPRTRQPHVLDASSTSYEAFKSTGERALVLHQMQRDESELPDAEFARHLIDACRTLSRYAGQGVVNGEKRVVLIYETSASLDRFEPHPTYTVYSDGEVAYADEAMGIEPMRCLTLAPAVIAGIIRMVDRLEEPVDTDEGRTIVSRACTGMGRTIRLLDERGFRHPDGDDAVDVLEACIRLAHG